VLNFSLGVLAEGLKDRAITRDLTWGVPIPLEGYDTKRIYVWFENVIGYLSATKEWAQRQGTPEAWREFWEEPDAKIYYFIGKDNVWFHTLSWPAQVCMDGGLNQPYDVPANQYLNMGGGKASTSRGTAPFLPVYLERYDPDTLRFYLSAIMPETSDSEFSDEDLVRRNNDELVSTWGNLVNRVLTITYCNFGGKVPDPGTLRDADKACSTAARPCWPRPAKAWLPAASVRPCAPRWLTRRRPTATSTRRSRGRRVRATRRPPRVLFTQPSAR